MSDNFDNENGHVGGHSEPTEVFPMSKDVDSGRLDCVFAQLDESVCNLSLLARSDPEQGLRIEVPAKLACYWEWHGQYPGRKWCAYDFHRLSKVQTIRFVELCVQHGFADDADAPVKAKMLPLHEWQPGDRVELERLLKIAAPETFDRRRQPW